MVILTSEDPRAMNKAVFCFSSCKGSGSGLSYIILAVRVT